MPRSGSPAWRVPAASQGRCGTLRARRLQSLPVTRHALPPDHHPPAARALLFRWAVPLLGLAAMAWQGLTLLRAMRCGRRMAQLSKRFETRPPRPHAHVLLLGDSTGVGVGTQPGACLSGLLAAAFPLVHIVNACNNGARVGDTLAQLRAHARAGQRFDLALVLAGGNDVLKLTSPRTLVVHTQALIHELCPMARQVVWLGSADIGTLPALKPPLNWAFGWLCRRTMKLLARTVVGSGIEFIDFCAHGHSRTFASQPERYFAADGLHPSAASYRHCFNELTRRTPLVALLTRQPLPAFSGHPFGAAVSSAGRMPGP